MSEIFYITTWTKKPYNPESTFVGTLDEIFDLGKKHGDCNLRCQEEEITAACAICDGTYQIVEDKWHGTVIVPQKGSQSREEMISKSQNIANRQWADSDDSWNDKIDYCVFG